MHSKSHFALTILSPNIRKKKKINNLKAPALQLFASTDI